MTAFDDTFVPLAKSLIDAYGTTATAVVTTGGTYDPTTGTYGTETETTYSVTITPPYPAKHEKQNGEVTETRTLVAYMAASGLDFDPVTAKWALEFRVLQYTKMEVNPIYSGAEVAAYEIVLSI